MSRDIVWLGLCCLFLVFGVGWVVLVFCVCMSVYVCVLYVDFMYVVRVLYV